MKNNTVSGSRALRTYWIVAGVLMTAIAAVLASLLHWGQAIEAADANYGAAAAAGGHAVCASGTRPGSAGRHRLRSRDGVPYVLVTPRNYRPQHGHPLLVVYAPAGFSAGLSERFAGLTHEATTAGYVLAFVASGPPLTPEAVRRMASVPAEVAAQWCIAPGRIYATGHSDGGTVSLALAALEAHRGTVDAIAVSGAGWQITDFIGLDCPPPLPVMILHGADDRHFPGFGRDAAQWWSSCNACSGEREPDAAGCRRYTGCAAETVYCETPRSHWRWAGAPHQVLEFLDRQSSQARALPPG